MYDTLKYTLQKHTLERLPKSVFSQLLYHQKFLLHVPAQVLALRAFDDLVPAATFCYHQIQTGYLQLKKKSQPSEEVNKTIVL